MTIDYKQFKTDHPIEQYADVPVTQKGHGHWINCPFPDHGDKNPSCQLYDDGSFYCHSQCKKGGDLFDLKELQYGWTRLEVIEKIGGIGIKPLPKRTKPSTTKIKLNLDSTMIKNFHSQLKPEHYSEWTRLGIHSDTLRHFQVGFNGRRYTFGWFYRGVLTAVKMRRSDTLYPDLEPKYTSMKGSRYATPYNIDSVILAEEPPDTIYIVEAERCVMALYQCGYTGISIPASGWKKQWNIFLSMSKQVVFIPDNDKAGFAAARTFLGVFPAAKVAKGHNRFSDEGVHIKDTADYLKAFEHLDFLID